MQKITIRDDFIKLGQALKLAGLVDSGVDAKIVIQNGHVSLNGKVETQRGKKVLPGDVVSFRGKEFVVENNKP
ncbi:MAG: RNA-binding S4 domain-containing protein [Lachnospiraceae bacterium]|nr:RNA-binding S4 domain-containing protein [Lachnospiraceae bacterium]